MDTCTDVHKRARTHTLMGADMILCIENAFKIRKIYSQSCRTTHTHIHTQTMTLIHSLTHTHTHTHTHECVRIHAGTHSNTSYIPLYALKT